MNIEELKKELKQKLISSFSKYSFERYIRRRRETEERFFQALSKIFEGKLEIYSVSEIIKCKKQVMIERNLVKNSEDFERYCFKPSMIFGDAIEERVLDLLGLKKGYFTFKIIDYFDKRLIITGSCDAIDDNYVYEIKAKTREPEPTPLMIMQCRLYAWLYNKPKCVLIIVSPKSIDVEVYDAYKDIDVYDILMKWSSPRWDFECRFCSYKESCDERKDILRYLQDFENFL